MSEQYCMTNRWFALTCQALRQCMLMPLHSGAMKLWLPNIMILPLWIITALLVGLLTAPAAFANSSECAEGTLTGHTFSSGASWSLCLQTSDKHGLEVTAVHYRAPGNSLRSVIERLHAGQILMHYHDEPEERPQLGNTDMPGRLLPISAGNCDGELLIEHEGNHGVCSRIENNRILAKYAQRPGLQSQRWELSSALQRQDLVWATSLSFTEDGQIIPAITLSGRARQSNSGGVFTSTLPGNNLRLARATVLTTWRMVFNLDDGAPDAVQQFDFPLLTSQGNQRPMQVTQLETESFAKVEREQFRGWRIMDAAGTGYYLDPSNSGFSFTGSQHDWAGFDVALTRSNDCERYALANEVPDSTQNAADSASMTGANDAATSASCGASLDDFVNGESLLDTHPVLWYSQSRTFNPTDEHWPVISNFHQSFTLQPFDWTQASPFEVLQ